MAKNVALILALAALAAMPQADARPLQDAPPPQYPRVPLAFQENRGQFDASVRFACRTSRATTFLTPTETVLVLNKPAGGSTLPDPSVFPAMPTASASQTAVLRFSLTGGNAPSSMVGVDRMACRFNYFSKEGVSVDVPAYRAVRSAAVYPGIDLLCVAVEQGLKYDFDVAPGANPGAIRISIVGSQSLEIDGAGKLVIHTAIGDVTLPAPVLYQTRNGVRVPVTGAYSLLGSAEVGFIVGEYDPAISLTIDPFLVFSTYLGGTAQEEAHDLVLDAVGNAYITGSTMSSDFPTQNPIQGSYGGGAMDAFVAKIDMTNNVLVYATYLGGAGLDNGMGIAVDASGNVVVVGWTGSTNFPVQNAYQSTKKTNAALNGFITKLSPQGNSLIFSTYLGGSFADWPWSVALDQSGNIYVAGRADSADFPVQGAYQSVLKGETDCFVTKLPPNGSSLLYSTFVGGNGIENAWSIAVDASGNAYATVQTDSADFPMKNAAQGTFPGGRTSGAVFKLNAGGNDLVWSTYQGGSGPGSGAATGIALDASGGVVVTGVATVGMPTLNAYQSQVGNAPFGESDSFITRFDGSTGARVYSTYFGNSGSTGYGVAVDGSGNAVFCGMTLSAGFPLQDAFDTTIAGNFEGFVAKIGPGGNTLAFSSYLGGNGDDLPFRVRLDSAGRMVVLGTTGSTDFPVVNPIQPTLLGSRNAFLARIANAPELSLTSTVTTNAVGVALSTALQLPTVAGGTTIEVIVPGTSVPSLRFDVTTLDGAVAVAIPAPSITEPFFGTVLTSTTPAVSGTASAPGLNVILLSNGITVGSATSDQNSFWTITPVGPIGLPMGTQSLAAYAMDAAGNSSPLSAPVTVTVDTAPPDVWTNFPAGQTISDSRPTISARWSDGVTGVMLGSVILSLQRSDGFYLDITSSSTITPGGFTYVPPAALQPGTYFVGVAIFDGTGQSGGMLYSFTYEPPPVFPTAGDSTAPEITFTSPPDGYILAQSSLLFYATVYDSGGSGLDSSNISLILNGVLMPASVTLSDPNNATIQFLATLNDGFHNALVEAKDLAGNPISQAVSFVVDTTSPSIVITSPSGTISSNSVSVLATITDSLSGVNVGSIQATLNGQSVTVTPVVTSFTSLGTPATINVTGTITAPEGSNQLVISVLDLAQHPGAESATFTVSSASTTTFPEVSDVTVSITNIEVITPPNENPPFGNPPIYEAPTSRPILVKVNVSEPGIMIKPTITSGEGTIFFNETYQQVSGADGKAGFGFLCPRKPGNSTVSVIAENATVSSALSYNFRARKVGGGVDLKSDWPGSGTWCTITADIGIGKTVVQLDEVTESGEIVTDAAVQKLELFKTLYTTESNATVVVPLLIKETASSGTRAYLRATYPEFSDENGDPIAPVGTLLVLPGSEQLQSRTKIVSGQSQIAARGKPLKDPIVAEPIIFISSPGSTITVIDASLSDRGDKSGTIMPLNSPEVFLMDPAGKSFRAQVNGTLSIRYTAGPDSKPFPAFINLISFRSTPEAMRSGGGAPANASGDVAVVRVPEIRIVQADDPTKRIQQLPLLPLRDILSGTIPASRQFRFEFELPEGEDSDFGLIWAGVGENGDINFATDPARLLGTLFPKSSALMPMTKIGAGKGNGIVYRSAPTVATLEQRTLLAPPTPAVQVVRPGPGGIMVSGPPVIGDKSIETFQPSMYPVVDPEIPITTDRKFRDFIGCGRAVGVVKPGNLPRITIRMNLRPDPKTLKDKRGVLRIRQEPINQPPAGTFIYNGIRNTVVDLDMRVVNGPDLKLEYEFNMPAGSHQDSDLTFTLITEDGTGGITGPVSSVLVPVRAVASLGSAKVTYLVADTNERAKRQRPSINLAHRTARAVWKQIGIDLGPGPNKVRSMNPALDYMVNFDVRIEAAIAQIKNAARIARDGESSTITVLLCDSVTDEEGELVGGITPIEDPSILPKWTAVERKTIFNFPGTNDTVAHEIGHIFNLLDIKVPTDATFHRLMYNSQLTMVGGELSDDEIQESRRSAGFHVVTGP